MNAHHRTMVFASCSSCGSDDTYLVCGKCRATGQFILSADGAQCCCSTKWKLLKCRCGALVTRQYFRIDPEPLVTQARRQRELPPQSFLSGLSHAIWKWIAAL